MTEASKTTTREAELTRRRAYEASRDLICPEAAAEALDAALFDRAPADERLLDAWRTIVAMGERIAAAAALHYPSDDHNEPGWDPYCVGCWGFGGMDGAPTYPCPTARALGADL